MKRILSMLLVLVMVLTLVPAGALAEGTTTVIVDSTTGQPGKQFDININIENNPGFAAGQMTCTFADGLSLVGAKAGYAFADLTMTKPNELSSGGAVSGSAKFTWLSSPDSQQKTPRDGIMLTLTFKVADGAKVNKNLAINVSFDGAAAKDNKKIYAASKNGYVTVLDYMPGDADEDGSVDLPDALMICQYYVDGCRYRENGYAIKLREAAADVNDDGEVDVYDALAVLQYVTDFCRTDPRGYNVKLLPQSPKCDHQMTAIAAKEATCTEAGNVAYWRCSVCDHYFLDADGKTRTTLEDVVIPALGHKSREVAATDEYTVGVFCDRCGKWLSGHEKIKANEAAVNYEMNYVKDKNGVIAIDPYLKDEYNKVHPEGIKSNSPATYVEGKTTSLGVPEAIGYKFLGWYAKPEAGEKRMYSIPSDSRGDITLYAVWELEEYKITYLADSSGSITPKVAEETYTTNKDTALQIPDQQNVVWVGWSDANGNIVDRIKKGSAGNITLTANWMSRRNQTVPNRGYASEKPIVVVDSEKGVYSFIYDIGEIQNVPIQVVTDTTSGQSAFNLTKGAQKSISSTVTKTVSNTEAQTLSDTIADATTRSDSWTLSENWNKSTTISKEHENEVSSEQINSAKAYYESTGKQMLSMGSGETTETVDENGNSTKTAVTNKFNANLNVGLVGKVGKFFKFKTRPELSANLGLGYEHSKQSEEEEYEKHTETKSAYWNTNASYEQSATNGGSEEFTSSLRQAIKDTTTYSNTLDFGGSKSNTVESSRTSSTSRQSTSSVTYSTEQGQSVTVNETLVGADIGWYRKVLAANFKVFAVVTYDAKTSTFSTMTYSLKINGSEKLFTDYSTKSSFNDYQNGVLPFVVPDYVGAYICSIFELSDGLRVDPDSGLVTSYGYKDPATGICYKSYNEDTGVYSDPCDTDVIIPQYVVADLGGGAKKLVKVTGISADAFKGTTVTSVRLNDSITTVPAHAFEDCKSLRYIIGGSITSIGDSAFKDCTSMRDGMEVGSNVTYLGKDAFQGAEGVAVKAANANVVESAMNCGAKSLKLDISNVKTGMDGKTLRTADGMTNFELIGGGNSYTNLAIVSDADATSISNINIIGNTGTGAPLRISSSKVNLNYVNVESNTPVMLLSADSTRVILDGNNYLKSTTDESILSKNLTFSQKAGSTISGKLTCTGDVLVCGTVKGENLLKFSADSYKIKIITADEYDKYLQALNNKLSDWVAADDVPEGATVVNNKWTYDETTQTTSKSATPPAGYTSYKDPTFVWGDYGAWSAWSRTAVSKSDTRKVEQKTVTDRAAYTNYKYYAYRTPDGYYFGKQGYTQNDSHGACTMYEEITLTSPLPVAGYSGATPYYGPYNTGKFPAGRQYYWLYNGVENVPAATHVEYRYADRVKDYTYYYQKVEAKESANEITAGGSISNVQHLVQYRVK